MQISKYRMVKKMQYKDEMDRYVFIETIGYKILKFMEENDISKDNMMYLDLKLLLEKKDEEK